MPPLFFQNLVFADPGQLMMCKLSSLPSQSGVQDLLRDFVRSDSARVLLLVANMQEASRQMVNHLRIMVEEAEAQRPQQAKLFVLLLHFPPAQFFDPCYPSLFLHSWDHYYLDTIAHGAVRGVVDICNWFLQCCFPQELPKEDSLLQTLQGFLPEAVPILSSRVFFGSHQGSTFNCSMNGSRRSQALKQLLFDKGVGAVLCEKFRSYWKPATMAEYLEKAAMVTKSRESTLSITDSIQTTFKGLFFDFLVYMVSLVNDDFNLDVLFAESCTPPVRQFFLDIVRSLSTPRLSQLKVLSTSPPVSRQLSHVPRFPFFKLVSEAVEHVVESCREEANQRANVLAEEPDSLTRSPAHNQSATLQQLACAKIQERVKVCLLPSRSQSLPFLGICCASQWALQAALNVFPSSSPSQPPMTASLLLSGRWWLTRSCGATTLMSSPSASCTWRAPAGRTASATGSCRPSLASCTSRSPLLGSWGCTSTCRLGRRGWRSCDIAGLPITVFVVEVVHNA